MGEFGMIDGDDKLNGIQHYTDEERTTMFEDCMDKDIEEFQNNDESAKLCRGSINLVLACYKTSFSDGSPFRRDNHPELLELSIKKGVNPDTVIMGGVIKNNISILLTQTSLYVDCHNEHEEYKLASISVSAILKEKKVFKIIVKDNTTGQEKTFSAKGRKNKEKDNEKCTIKDIVTIINEICTLQPKYADLSNQNHPISNEDASYRKAYLLMLGYVAAADERVHACEINELYKYIILFDLEDNDFHQLLHDICPPIKETYIKDQYYENEFLFGKQRGRLKYYLLRDAIKMVYVDKEVAQQESSIMHKFTKIAGINSDLIEVLIHLERTLCENTEDKWKKAEETVKNITEMLKNDKDAQNILLEKYRLQLKDQRRKQ